MSAHDAEARAEARVQRWSPATPAADLLRQARAGVARHRWQRVEGPHLRCARTRDRRCKTGVVGISLGRVFKGGRYQRVLVVNLGSTNRRVYVESIGMGEAWKRALKVRAAHECRVAAANALILAARERAEREAR